MATITLRATKGSPLTNNEVDANFNNINTELGTKLDAADFTGAEILTKIKTVDGALSGLDADTVDGATTATTNTADTIVLRDSSGNFAAGTITADTNFVATGNAAFSGRAAITSGTISGITDLAIADGGTGAGTASGARTNLGLAIGSDVQAYSATLDALATVATGSEDLMLYTDGSNSFATTALTSAARTLLDDTSISAMRSTLGLRIGTDIQAYDPDLSALGALSTTGIITRTGSGTVSSRTITGSTGISVVNGNGVNGNPTITNTGVTSLNGQAGAISDFSGHTGGGNDRVFLENDNQITTSYTITTNKNAVTAGPVEILNNVTVTVPNGSSWTIV